MSKELGKELKDIARYIIGETAKTAAWIVVFLFTVFVVLPTLLACIAFYAAFLIPEGVLEKILEFASNLL